MPKRRSRKRGVDHLLDVVAAFPWWAGVALAIGSYLLFNHWASAPAPKPAPGQAVGAVVAQSIGYGIANVAQLVLPLVCLAGAAVSAWRRRARQSLAADVAQSAASDALDGMAWQQFEQLVSEAFRLQGYRVVETGGGGADGGVDLVLAKRGEKFLVQCKQWRALKVGVDVVRQLYGVMAARGATGGYVVTSGRFTAEATAFASGRNVQLIDGPQLHALLRRAQTATRGAPPAVKAPPTADPAVGAPQAAAKPPACPLCSNQMVLRSAKRGGQAGAPFWGCSGFPRCRGTRAVQ